jgi:hypothetical protein
MIIGAINTSDNMWDKWISFDDDTVPNKVDKSTDTIVLNQDNVAINIVPDKIDKTIADINNSEKINKKEIFSSDSNKNMNNGFKKKSKTKTNNKNIMNYNVLDSIKDELDSAFDSD